MHIIDDCKCRLGQVTKYHTAADLEHIMNVSCPAHGFCDLGELLWVPPGMPLRPEDQYLCSCLSNPTRELLEGRRGPLTEEEQEAECSTWEPELTAGSDEHLSIEQTQLELLLNSYARKRSRS